MDWPHGVQPTNIALGNTPQRILLWHENGFRRLVYHRSAMLDRRNFTGKPDLSVSGSTE
jgi:hypothetical protein